MKKPPECNQIASSSLLVATDRALQPLEEAPDPVQRQRERPSGGSGPFDPHLPSADACVSRLSAGAASNKHRHTSLAYRECAACAGRVVSSDSVAVVHPPPAAGTHQNTDEAITSQAPAPADPRADRRLRRPHSQRTSGPAGGDLSDRELHVTCSNDHLGRREVLHGGFRERWSVPERDQKPARPSIAVVLLWPQLSAAQSGVRTAVVGVRSGLADTPGF